MKPFVYIVGPRDGPGAALLDVARAAGFAHVAPYTGLAAAEIQAQQTPLLAFLFAEVSRIDALRPIIESIRYSSGRKLRFSPLIYFSECPSHDDIQDCMALGFDDVLTTPFTPSRLQSRLLHQIGRTQVYLETEAYFGPAHHGTAERRRGPYRRLEVIRSVTLGTNVLRDDVIARR